MKAQKYRIGNFASINNQKIKLTPKYFKSLDTFKYIEPLILNEQILIDFGFSVTGTTKYPVYKKGCYSCYRMYGTMKIANPHGFVADLTYVHELQNLFFVLNKKELELIK